MAVKVYLGIIMTFKFSYHLPCEKKEETIGNVIQKDTSGQLEMMSRTGESTFVRN